MKKIIVWALALVILLPVLLLAAIFGVPQMVDWNAKRDDVAAFISKKSGMKITLEGDLQFATWPQPMLSVGGIKVAAYNGKRDLFTAENIAIEMSARKLATLGLGIQSFVMEKPQVYLNVDAKGVPNWLPKRAKKRGGSSRSGSSAASDMIKSFGETVVSDAQFLYENEQTGERFLVDDVQVSIEGRKPSESQLNATMKINEIETSLNYKADLSNFANIVLDGETFFGLSTVKIKGALLNLSDFDGDVDLRGEDLLKNIYTVLNLPPEHRTFTMPIYLKTGLQSSADTLLLKDLQVSANGENVASLKGEIKYKAASRGQGAQLGVKLRADEVLDLNEAGLCTQNSVEKTPASKGKKGSDAPWTEDLLDLSALENVQAEVDVQTNKVVCGDISIDAVNVLGEISGGKVNLTRAEIRQGEGLVNTTAVMNIKNNLKTVVDVNVENLPLEKFLSAAQRKTVSAPVLGNIKLDFQGKSTLDWVKNLKGRIELGSQDLYLQSFAFDSLLFAAKDFFGQKSDKPDSLSEKKASFTMAYDIESGVMKTDTFNITTGEGTLNGSGKIDLVNWKINYKLIPGDDVKMAVVIPVKVQGNLSSPIIAPDMTSPQGIGAGIGAAVGGPLGAGVGAVLGNTLDKKLNKKDKKNPLGGLFKQLEGR